MAARAHLRLGEADPRAAHFGGRATGEAARKRKQALTVEGRAWNPIAVTQQGPLREEKREDGCVPRPLWTPGR